MRPRRRRRNRVAAVDGLAVYLEFERDELPRLEHERAALRRAEEKALHVVRFLPDVAAHQRFLVFARPARGQRAPEFRLRHTAFHGLKGGRIPHHCLLLLP
jgi:hypothetical protein